MRQLLAVNDSSIGLRMLDDMAAALINEQDRAAATLKTRVQILPLPSRQASTVVALPHSDFTDATVPAAGPAAVPQKRASLGTPAKGSKAKNPRSSTWSSTETTPPTLDFELSPDTPATVRQAIETIYAKAVAAKRAPYKLAYPWGCGTILRTIQESTWRIDASGMRSARRSSSVRCTHHWPRPRRRGRGRGRGRGSDASV
ncbi:hypothetical protein PF011_g12526 [Phytophthora fragariae]|uniref:Uncharacterized protein n=1 Tax=Phytophthora fragariae TaxID=53985 RepID=A0A6A3KHI1_9STRA|nr:hypothetical protein PF011_g12526 [Phytophthora fragariae]